MRTYIHLSILLSIAAGSLPAGTISLGGSSDLVAFNGKAGTITLGSVGCSTPDTGTCTYQGSQSLGSGTLTWAFQTPNTTGNITFDGIGDVYGPTGGTFSARDGVDSLNGSYTFSSWNYDSTSYDDGDFYGIDLNGTIIVTGLTLEGGGDPNESAFESYLSVPGTASYSITLDVGDCTANGNKTVACIAVPDPTAYFNGLTLSPQGTVPEPGTLGLMAVGLLATFAAHRRIKKVTAGREQGAGEISE